MYLHMRMVLGVIELSFFILRVEVFLGVYHAVLVSGCFCHVDLVILLIRGCFCPVRVVVLLSRGRYQGTWGLPLFLGFARIEFPLLALLHWLLVILGCCCLVVP